MKKVLSAILAGVLLVSMVPSALAASDLDGHWAKNYITYLSRLEIMRPSADGSYKPDQQVSRAEFMRYVNRAFNFTEKANISFTDVPQYDSAGNVAWYYEPIQIAVKQGYITGVGDNKMDPFGPVTREQAATIICRLHKFTPDEGVAASVTFTDKAQIGGWSMDYIAQAVQDGYISGYPNGTFVPRGNITRAQMAKILYDFMGTSLEKANGNYTNSDLQADTKNVTISAPCTLQGATVPGDLYITEGVLSGAVQLKNVTVGGRIIVSGGTVTLDGVTSQSMVVSSPVDRLLQVTATGATSVGLCEVQSSATLRENALVGSAGGFADLWVTGDNKPAVTLEGAVWDIKADSPATLSTTSDTSINTLTANAAVTVSGYGSIHQAILNADGCDLAVKPELLELASGVSGTVAGEAAKSQNQVSITPSVLSFDVGNSGSISQYTELTLSADAGGVAKMVCDDRTLRADDDYRLTDTGFRLYKTYIEKLDPGTYTLTVQFVDGTSGTLTLKITDSARNAAEVTELHFDKNAGGTNSGNLSVPVTLASGGSINSIKVGGKIFTDNDGYLYNAKSKVIVIDSERLAVLGTGEYTMTITVDRGNNLSLKLIVEDTSPKNAVLPTSVDFDTNGGSDIEVKLTYADGAKLNEITCGKVTLEEDWQYRFKDADKTTVILSRSALSSLRDNTSGDALYLTFEMNKGRNPELRVDFVQTYSVRVELKDDRGVAIEGASVTVSPAGNSTEEKTSAEQTIKTDAKGEAVAYVKRGDYIVTVKSDKLREPMIKPITVLRGQTLTLTAEILENVELTVTDTTGALVSGASVTLGTQTQTTGADGVAAFTIKRGDYTARVICSGYQTASEQITVSGTVRTRIRLQKG